MVEKEDINRKKKRFATVQLSVISSGVEFFKRTILVEFEKRSGIIMLIF